MILYIYEGESCLNNCKHNLYVMKKNTTIDGIAASEHLDSSGESLSIEGMDISSLGGPDSILNWEHGSKDRPSQVVGKVTFAKKIMKKEQAKTKREKKFWNKIKKPFVYIKAELFDGIGHSGAQDVAAMLRYKNKDRGEESRLVVGFSIEGGKMDKKGMVVTKSIARDVAITVKPCNKVCDAEVIENTSDDEDFLYKNQEFDCEILEKGSYNINTSGYRDLLISDIKKNTYTGGLSDPGYKNMKTGDTFIHNKTAKPKTGISGSDLYNDPKTFESNTGSQPPKRPKKPSLGVDQNYDPTTWNTDNNMRKALIAGMMGGAPSAKTGTAALTAEDLDTDLKKVNKKDKLKKNEENEGLYLEHYSPHQGLKSINTDPMGSGVDRRTKGRSLDNKISFYYPHKYDKPEHRVKSASKSKYTVKVPGDYKVWDSKTHGGDLVTQAKERAGGAWDTDHFIDVLKENGYHGFKSSPSGINMVAMFHDLPVHSEEEVDHRIKKNEKLEKTRPLMINKEMKLGQDPRSDVKNIDPNKTFKTSSGKTVSQADLETRKLQQEYRNKEKQISGLKPGYDFTPDSKKEIGEYQKQFKVDTDTASAENIQDPDYGINRSYSYKQKDTPKNEVGPEIHETTHGFFSDLSSKYGDEKASKLSRHMLDKFFHSNDLANVKNFIESKYDKDYPHMQEEHITHIADILNRPSVRKEFLSKYGNTAKLGPNASQEDKKLALQLDRRTYKRLASGWNKSVNFIKDSGRLSDFLGDKKAKR